MHTLFRRIYRLRFWSQLQSDDDTKEMFRKGSSMLEVIALEQANHGWKQNNRLTSFWSIWCLLFPILFNNASWKFVKLVIRWPYTFRRGRASARTLPATVRVPGWADMLAGGGALMCALIKISSPILRQSMLQGPAQAHRVQEPSCTGRVGVQRFSGYAWEDHLLLKTMPGGRHTHAGPVFLYIL
jgi:hypothetical protein